MSRRARSYDAGKQSRSRHISRPLATTSYCGSPRPIVLPHASQAAPYPRVIQIITEGASLRGRSSLSLAPEIGLKRSDLFLSIHTSRICACLRPSDRCGLSYSCDLYMRRVAWRDRLNAATMPQIAAPLRERLRTLPDVRMSRCPASDTVERTPSRVICRLGGRLFHSAVASAR